MQSHHWPTAVLKAVTAFEFPAQDIIWCRVGFGKKFCRLGFFFISDSSLSVFQVQGGDECCFLKHPGTPTILVSTCPALRLGLASGWIHIRCLLECLGEWLEDTSKTTKMQEWPRFVHSSADVRLRFWVSRWWTQLWQIELGILSLQEHLQFWAARFDKCGAKHFNKGRNWKVCPHCQPGSSPMSFSWRILPVNQIQVNLREVWQQVWWELIICCCFSVLNIAIPVL